MPALVKVKIRGKTESIAEGSKAHIARFLLDAGYTVAEISKAVPMAYSQVHSIAAKDRKTAPKAKPTREPVVASDWGLTPKAPAKRSMKPMTSPVLDAIKKGKPIDVAKIGTGKVGKLRTPGLPSDTAVGECANCGFDLVIRTDKQTGQMFFMHVNLSSEDYLNVAQFCHGVPRVLIA